MNERLTGTQAAAKHVDLLRRFTATPLAVSVKLMGRNLRLETNCDRVFSRVVRLFERYPRVDSGPCHFLWRIVSDKSSGLRPPWPEMIGFSCPGLRYVNLGQRSFFAVDIEAREAIAFISEELVQDGPGFSSVFLATLFDLTTGALDLVPISAACVAQSSKALLVFGSPRSGKTTSSYYASQMGFKVHADQASYAERAGRTVRIWGQFWPAAFRRETARYLPEIGLRGRPFTYGRSTFLCFETPQYRLPEAHSATAAACVFLERERLGKPRLRRLTAGELGAQLRKTPPLRDDACFEVNRAAVLKRLARLPSYQLRYGKNPKDAAQMYCELLTAHASLEDGV
ncbi:MAG: hypothetical protein ACRD2B_07225 [Terriglobia bacterium]